MHRRIFCIAVMPTLLAATVATASAQQAAQDFGKNEYEFNCAACHGVSGKGDGPAAVYLTPKPADLTTLTRTNNGVFPVARVYEVIDGSQQVKGHGSRDMPIWGREYRLEAGERNFEGPPYSPGAYVRVRILALIEYLSRLQTR